jgi:ubiquinone/menaquinone biosynthesis C-methylase UbiE
MRNWLKKILPERIPAVGAVLYSGVVAKMFMPHYQMVADSLHLKDGQKVVDIGTGPGWLPIKIAARFPLVTAIGIDLSEKMIAIANRNKEKNESENDPQFLVADAGQLPFEANSIDQIVSTGVMHHWKEPVRIFKEIYRVLKPGGEAWIYDGNGGASDHAIEKGIKQILPGFPGKNIVRRILGIHGFTKEEYETAVREFVAQTPFKTCALEGCGIMMRVRVKKSEE